MHVVVTDWNSVSGLFISMNRANYTGNCVLLERRCVEYWNSFPFDYPLETQFSWGPTFPPGLIKSFIRNYVWTATGPINEYSSRRPPINTFVLVFAVRSASKPIYFRRARRRWESIDRNRSVTRLSSSTFFHLHFSSILPSVRPRSQIREMHTLGIFFRFKY